METIVEALKLNKPRDELLNLYNSWESHGKNLLFLDLAIVHRCYNGVKLIGELEGPNVYETPYDEWDRVTPLYISQLLSSLSDEYMHLTQFMLRQIEYSQPWPRRRGILWTYKHANSMPIKRLPKSIIRYIAEHFC